MWKAAKFLKRCSLLVSIPSFIYLKKGGNKTYLSVELQWIPGKGSPLLVSSFILFLVPPPPHPLISKAVSVERGMQHIRKLERKLIFTCQQAFDLPTEFIIVSQEKKKKKRPELSIFKRLTKSFNFNIVESPQSDRSLRMHQPPSLPPLQPGWKEHVLFLFLFYSHSVTLTEG